MQIPGYLLNPQPQCCVPCSATPTKQEQSTALDTTPITVAVIGAFATIIAAKIASS